MAKIEFTTDIFAAFDKKWALLTAGHMDRFNTMTISWGGLGTIWGRPTATVYVRESRFTHEFMDAYDDFTVSFYPEAYRKTLGVLGSKSGRTMDKMRKSGLTPVAAGDAVSFREAEITLVCRKMFMQRLEPARIPADIVKALYADGDAHDMYLGEVVEIIS